MIYIFVRFFKFKSLNGHNLCSSHVRHRAFSAKTAQISENSWSAKLQIARRNFFHRKRIELKMKILGKITKFFHSKFESTSLLPLVYLQFCIRTVNLQITKLFALSKELIFIACKSTFTTLPFYILFSISIELIILSLNSNWQS